MSEHCPECPWWSQGEEVDPEVCPGLALPAVDACVCCAASGCQDPTACACSTQGGERRARAVDAVAFLREKAERIARGEHSSPLQAGRWSALTEAADELEGRKG